VLRYAITDGSLSGKLQHESVRQPARQSAEPSVGDSILELSLRCRELASEGVEFLLLREKDLAAGELAQICWRIVDEVAVSGTKVLVARRLDVALACGADGVHLSAAPGELTVKQVREVFPSAVVSVSCHTLDDVRRAHGASMVLFGPIFGKTVDGVEVVAGVGLERLQQACLAAGQMPVFALGGVTEANAADCIAAGAAGVAAIRMFFAERAT
jgi:thiamine-phosphate pyrophosphorylase